MSYPVRSIFELLEKYSIHIHQFIERMVEIYTKLYIHLCMHKIPHSFDHCDCIAFRLYAKLLSTHGPNLAYCAKFLNKLVNIYMFYNLRPAVSAIPNF